MFRRSVIIVAALLLSFASRAQSVDYAEFYESENVNGMMEHLNFLSDPSLKGRKAGSAGEKTAAEYFARCLRKSGVELLTPDDGEVFGVKSESGDTLISRNVYGAIQGYDKTWRNHYIVIGARLDNLGCNLQNVNGVTREQVYSGACGNASGLAMLLQLAKQLQKNSVMLRRSVIIAAFGASVPLQAGSWYFLNGGFPQASSIDAMINLDMLGTGSGGFYAYTASNPDLNNLLRKLSLTLQPVQPQVVGLEPVASDHRSFYNAEIPAAFFTTGRYPEYNTVRDTPDIIQYGWMEKEMEYIYNFTLSLVNGPSPEFRQKEQKKPKDSKSEVVAYRDCDVPPTFLGSSEPSSFLLRWVYTYLRYPDDCVDEGVQGRVLVSFIVDEKGNVGNVRILRSLDPRLDAEVVRVVSASPKWKPGVLRGRKVRSEVSMYVEFKLKKR
ncbi:MAG: TonB family protein [Bacteroidales bacterium]|nr:TonB family protein [Bacteroidales bacterium]